jgi:hypothetical protein
MRKRPPRLADDAAAVSRNTARRTRSVRARNTAQHSDNKIHDDTVALAYGFAGGLVPGRDVAAHMAHFAVARWGMAWLSSGSMTVALKRAVYHDDVVTVIAEDISSSALAIKVRDSGDTVCATALASLSGAAGGDAAEGETAVGGRPSADTGAPGAPIGVRPMASPMSLAVGTLFAPHDECFLAADAASYLDEIGETLPLFVEHGVAHPGWVLKQANWVLMDNVVLGPWIHVSSVVTNFAVIIDGDAVSTRARVTEEFERKGHRLVVLDVLLVVRDDVVARIHHTVIYEPRRKT